MKKFLLLGLAALLTASCVVNAGCRCRPPEGEVKKRVAIVKAHRCAHCGSNCHKKHCPRCHHRCK